MNVNHLLCGFDTSSNNSINWGINKPWSNPDSQIIAAMENEIVYKEFEGTDAQLAHICHFSNRYGRFDYSMSREENESRYIAEEKSIAERIQKIISNNGKIYSISWGREIGIITLDNGHISNLYIEGKYQGNGFGTLLLAYVLSIVTAEAYIDVPVSNKTLLHICDKLGLKRKAENELTVRMIKS